MNVPIYRAKKIDSDEYAQGFYEGWENKHFIIISPKEYFKINITTLEISFDNGKSFIKLCDLEIHTCTDFDLKYTDMKMRNRQEKQPPNGNIFTIITDKGR